MIQNYYCEKSKFIATFNRKYWALNTSKWNDKKVTPTNIFKNNKSPYNSLETTCFAMKFGKMVN